MERDKPKRIQMADDLDDISTLMNLLELRSLLRQETSHFENDLD